MSVLLLALAILAMSIAVAGHTRQMRLDQADEQEAEAWIRDLRAIRAQYGEQ